MDCSAQVLVYCLLYWFEGSMLLNMPIQESLMAMSVSATG